VGFQKWWPVPLSCGCHFTLRSKQLDESPVGDAALQRNGASIPLQRGVAGQGELYPAALWRESHDAMHGK